MKNLNICGIDECGRGCLAGPVVASCVIYNEDLNLPVDDSKKIREKERVRLASIIKENCPYGIGWVWPWEIDKINIHNASLLAMQRAYINLRVPCKEALVDGKFTPSLNIPTKAIIKGDEKIPSISAASIVAKVSRDLWISLYDQFEPEFGFKKHKGYATNHHAIAIREKGSSHIQRRTFSIPTIREQYSLKF